MRSAHSTVAGRVLAYRQACGACAKQAVPRPLHEDCTDTRRFSEREREESPARGPPEHHIKVAASSPGCLTPTASPPWRHALGVSSDGATPQAGAHTACDLPNSLRDFIAERGRCLPHRKHDIVAAPNEAPETNGEPATFER